MNIARSSLKLFVANVTGAGVQFLGITLFARELGASQMGVFFLFQALLGMIAIPADFGVRGAVEKRISEGGASGAYLSSAIVLKSVPITVIIGGILLLQPFINNYVGARVATPLAGAIILQEMAKLAVVVLKGELRVGETAVLNVTRHVTWTGGGLLLVNYGLEAEAMIYSLLAGLGIMMVWGWYKTSVSLGKPSVNHARSLFDYSKYSVVSSIGGYFYSWMDVAIIGLFLTQADVGAYEVAWRVTAITMLFSNAIAATVFPQISQWDAENETNRIKSVIRNSITPSLLLTIPAFFGVLVLSRNILGLIFGPEFTAASIVLIILMGEKVLQSVHVILGRSLQAINQPDLAAVATTVSVLVNLILNIILIYLFGIVGAAVATTISFAINTLLHGYYLSKSVKIDFPHSEIVWSILSSVGMAVVLFGLQMVFIINTLPNLIIMIILGAGLYLGLLLSFRPLRMKIVGQSMRLISTFQ